MINEVTNDYYDLKKEIIRTCGRSFSLVDRIRYNNYGSTRYKLQSIECSKYNIDLQNYTDSIYLNFDLRSKGIVFAFRYMHTEYVEYCSYYRLSMQSSDDNLVLQTDSNIYSFKILSLKGHKKFINDLYKFKNNNHEKTLEHK